MEKPKNESPMEQCREPKGFITNHAFQGVIQIILPFFPYDMVVI